MSKGITVRQLRDLLNGLPDEVLDFGAVVEACDCEDDASGVLIETAARRVHVLRVSPSYFRAKAYAGCEVRTP